MNTWNEIMQKLVNEDYNTLLGMARETFNSLLPTFKKIDTENDGAALAFFIISSAIAADGQLTVLENKFIGDLLGVSTEVLIKMIQSHESKIDDLVEKLVDSLPQNERSSLILLIATIAASDETISRDENAFLKRLMD